MTEELEKKLNELLGLKEQLEAITAGKHEGGSPSLVKRYKIRVLLTWAFYGLNVLIGAAFVMLGGWGLEVTGGEHGGINLDAPACIIVGLLILVFGKMFFLIRRNRLSIMQEMKQFELRITEMLKN